MKNLAIKGRMQERGVQVVDEFAVQNALVKVNNKLNIERVERWYTYDHNKRLGLNMNFYLPAMTKALKKLGYKQLYVTPYINAKVRLVIECSKDIVVVP